jgi:4-methyl-5(b-hydroxyethyl)-thiazole monophosphate biosynthesis
MKRVYTFLADGFEEVEALTVVDLLRRAEIETKLVSVTGKEMVIGAHGIGVQADEQLDTLTQEADALFLPGGMPGTLGLGQCEKLCEMLKQYAQREDKWLMAICAAPSVLGELGILKGKKATCYPGFEDKLVGATVLDKPVVQDGHVLTSRGVGTAIDLGLAAITCLTGSSQLSEQIGKGIMYL